MNIRHTLGRFAAEAARALRNFKYEMAQDGRVFLSGSKVFVGGVFSHAHAPAGAGFSPWAIDPNRLVTEGLIHILNSALGGQSQTAQYYLAPFSGNVTPGADWKGSNFASQATEFTAYEPSARLPWTVAPATTVASLGNAAALSASTLTFKAGGPYNIYGVGLVAAAAKGATTGPLVAATRFAAPRTNMLADDRLAIEYVINAKDEGDA